MYRLDFILYTISSRQPSLKGSRSLSPSNERGRLDSAGNTGCEGISVC